MDPGNHLLDDAKRAKPANARLVAAAIRDTRGLGERFLPKDRVPA